MDIRIHTIKASKEVKYLDISICYWHSIIDMGLHDKAQAKELLVELENAVEEVKSFIGNEED